MDDKLFPQPIQTSRDSDPVATPLFSSSSTESPFGENGIDLCLLVEDGANLVASYSLDGQCSYASPACRNLLGYDVTDFLAVGLEDICHPQDLPLLQEFWQEIIRQGSCVSFDYRARHRQGHYRWLEVSGKVVQRSLTGQASVMTLSRDVTDRKEAEDRLKMEVERGRLLSAIAQRIRGSLNLRDILATTVAEVRQFLGTHRVFIYRLHEDGAGSILVESSSPENPPIIDPTSLGLGSPDWIEPCGQGHACAIADLHTAALTDGQRESLEHLQVRACLIMPILQNSHLWGLLVAHHCHSPRTWESHDVEFLEQLATQVAIAIQQSELYQQVQQLNTDLENKVRERTAQLEQVLNFEAALKQITDKVRDSLDESEILQAAVKALAEVLQLNSCNASIYDLQKRTSTIRYEYTMTVPESKGRVLQMTIFQELYGQLLKGMSFQFCSLLPNPVRGRVALLACPIQDDQGVLGDLWLVNTPDDAFNEQAIQLAQQVASQCAIALRQARLYQAAQQQVKELEKLNQLKDDFLSTVSHELRTPISNMKLAIRMLQEGPDIQRQQRYLQILQDECEREGDLIDDLLDLQRLEANAYCITGEMLSLQEWLPRIIEPFRSQVQSYDQTLTVDIPDHLLPVRTDQTSLGRVLAEVLHNACKYTPASGGILLRIRQETEPGETEPKVTLVAIANQATIPHPELARVFEKFYRIPNADPWKRGGTGLGLALVKQLVEQLGGTIQANSARGWTTFSIRLPNLPQLP